jgi:predicted RND superfamily exporter protein
MERFYKHPVAITVVIAVITVFFAIQLPRAEMDNNNASFIPKEQEARVIAEHIEEALEPSMMIMIGLERPYGTVFDPVFLERVREYSDFIETVEFVKNVNSIMSTQYITGNADSIIVTDLVPEDFAGTPEEISELKRRIASWDMFRGALVSDNLSATQVIANLNVKTEDAGHPDVVASLVEIRETAKEMFAGLAEVYVTGTPVISATINEAMGVDLVMLIPLVAIVVLLVLLFSFRRFTFVALPLLTVVIAVIWTIGAMPLFGIKLSVISTVLPVILMAVGSAYGIHVVTHYMEDTRNRSLSVEEHRALVFTLMRKLIKPVFLASLTTFAGFASFCFTSILPMRDFGYFSSFGVLVSFIVAVTLIPSVLLIRGPRVLKEREKKSGGDTFNRTIGNTFVAIARKRILVISLTVIALAFSGYGLSKLVVDNNIVEFFKSDTDISRSDRFIREYFGGSRDVTILVEADTSDELLDPAVLSAMDGLSSYLTERVPDVGKVVGFTDVIKRVNQVFNVDEGPDGLKPVSTQSAAGTGFGFGFDDEESFGFGFDSGEGFGFDTPVNSQTIAAEALEDAGYTGGKTLDQYSAADIIAILDTAAGKSPKLSGAELVRELERLTNYNGFSYYEIPALPERYGKKSSEELRQLVSNYLVLLSGDDSFDYSNDPLEPTAIKMSIQLRVASNNEIETVVGTIKNYIDANFPKTARVMVSGGAMMENAIANLIVSSQITSIFVSVLMVFIIIAFSYRSLIAGLIGAVPLSIAILGNFAIMGFFNIKLDIGTALIASLAVGIGIDYTIHFIDFFKREYQSDKSSGADFLRKVFTGCGKAIIINAVSVGAGFGVLAFSQFRILSNLGILVALSMFISAFVSLTVIPVLLMTIKPKFIYGVKNQPTVLKF